MQRLLCMFLGCCGGRPVPANSNGSVCVCVCSLFVCVCVCFRMFRGLGFPEAIRSSSSVCSSTNSFLHVFGGEARSRELRRLRVCVCVLRLCVCVCLCFRMFRRIGLPERFAAAALCVSCAVQQLCFAAAALSPQNAPCAFALAPHARFC